MNNKKEHNISDIISSIIFGFYAINIPFATCSAFNLYNETHELIFLIMGIFLSIICIFEVMLVSSLVYKEVSNESNN